jgi:hypothetical protein
MRTGPPLTIGITPPARPTCCWPGGAAWGGANREASVSGHSEISPRDHNPRPAVGEKDHPQLLCSEGVAGNRQGRPPTAAPTDAPPCPPDTGQDGLPLAARVRGGECHRPSPRIPRGCSRPSRSVRRTRRYVRASAATPFTLSCEPIKPLLAGDQDFPHEPWRLPTLERTRERRHGASDGRKDVGLEVAALIDRRCAAIKGPRRRCDRTTRQQVSRFCRRHEPGS